MYSAKEKNKHLRALQASQHAEKDLRLLKSLDPKNDRISSFELSPARFAEEILYTLLDLATAEEIRDNRRTIELSQTREEENTGDIEPKQEADKLESDKEMVPGVVVENVVHVDYNNEPEGEKTNEKDDSEKKSPANKKTRSASKKKPSIQKSTGKTSRTKTSK